VRIVDAVTIVPSEFVYVATMTEVPTLIAETRPGALPFDGPIVATSGVLDVHVTEFVRFSVCPVPVVPVTVNPSVLVFAKVIVGLAGVKASEVTSEVVTLVGEFTVKVEALLIMSPLNPGMLAAICENPVACPETVAIPELLMVTSKGV
jgi:hypothetical protein